MNIKDKGNKLLDLLDKQGKSLPHIRGLEPMDHNQSYRGNIENFIGFAQVPIGLAGPLLLQGSVGDTEHWIPMATTEGALVASYNRGIKAGNSGGGFLTRATGSAVQRSPYVEFDNLVMAIEFVNWIKAQLPLMKVAVTSSSRFAKLLDLEVLHEGNGVHLTFSYETGAAAGQNMVTIVTEQILKQVLSQAPHKPCHYYIEGNMSGDKKANLKSLSKIRGRKVVSEVVITATATREILKSTPERIVKFWQTGTLAAVYSGAVGNHGHVTNALTAIFMACGQDVACIAEAAVGVGRMEVTSDGDLYASLTLPGIIVGTVGGGTSLPTQKEALALMGCDKPEHAGTLAELCGAVALAGELSIGAAIAEGHFTAAHQAHGRKS